METKSYLASDLANELGVARSTVNDWLSRYADYLETENRGKRRAYSEKSLRILREISEFRNNGLSSFEIEQQLAARYGLRPEVTAPQMPPAGPAASSVKAAGEPIRGAADEAEGAASVASAAPGAGEAPSTPDGGGAAAENAGDAALPMVRPAFEAVTMQINREFEKLASQLEVWEAERRRLLWRLRLLSAVIAGGAVLLMAAIALTARFLYVELADQRAADSAEVAALGTAMSGEVDALRNEQRRAVDASEKKLAEVTVLLDRSRSDFQRSLAELESELALQRQGFEETLKKLESAVATRHEAEVIRLKEEFARRQQEVLTEAVASYEAKVAELEKNATDAESVRAEAVAARKKAEEEAAVSRREIEELRRRVAELLKARNPSIPAPGESAEEKESGEVKP